MVKVKIQQFVSKIRRGKCVCDVALHDFLY